MTKPITKPYERNGTSQSLRRRASEYRKKADEIREMLRGTQEAFTGAFAALDAQKSTRDRIADTSRRKSGQRSMGADGKVR